MDPRRKRIYIILIVVCFGLSAAILGWSYFSNPTSPPVPSNTTAATGGIPNTPPASQPTVSGGPADFSNGYPSPSVFPASDAFDSSVLDSSGFKGLTDYTLLNTQGLLGRDNPFKNY